MLDRDLVPCYRVPAGEAQSEQEIKRSVFVGTMGHAANIDAAHAFVSRICERYPDANHHAWAYRIGPGPQIEIGSSDDGEPGGTAGRPMLAVLEGSQLCEVVVVGTRYFGGRKLGTGGLVRAYGGAARETLKVLPTLQRTLHYVAEVSVSYALYGTLQYQLPQLGVLFEDAAYAADVRLTIAVPHDRVQETAQLLQETTNGSVLLEACWTGHRYVES